MNTTTVAKKWIVRRATSSTTTGSRWWLLPSGTATTPASSSICYSCRSISSGIPLAPSPLPSPSHIDPKLVAMEPEIRRRMNRTGEEPVYKLGKHRSNAMELVHKHPIIEVDGDRAICDGGGGALGHPLEYISLARPGKVEYCKYCALRFTKKKK